MPWSHPALATVAAQLTERTGLAFPEHRQEGAELGIRRAMSRAGITDPEEYAQRLQADGPVLDELIVELTVGETYFFREWPHFEFIRRQVLPEIQQRRGAAALIRIWSAGCASGEEPYSLAILLETEGLHDRANILATASSREALARAQAGTYRPWSLRDWGASVVAPYLRRSGDTLVLDERFRRRVRFQYLNLAQDVYPSWTTGICGIDLILCRNVLIYLDADAIRRVAARLYEALAPGGWLILGSCDPPLREAAPFEAVVTGSGIFYRRPVGPGGHVVTAAERCSAESKVHVGAVTVACPETPRNEPSAEDRLEAARQAAAVGNYARAVELTRRLTSEAGQVLHVRALANLDTRQAEQACTEALRRRPVSTELHYLRAVLLLDLGRDEDAIQALRHMLYLDRSLTIAHSTLGTILWRQGDRAGARRAFRRALALSAARPVEELVPLAEGEHAGRLAAAAAAQLAILDGEMKEQR